jgi:hypothetical protein
MLLVCSLILLLLIESSFNKLGGALKVVRDVGHCYVSLNRNFMA